MTRTYPLATAIDSRQWVLLFVGWLLAVISTAGSLFLSEVMDYAPCVLCWYQRIPMYALAVILAIVVVLFLLNRKKR